MNAPFTSPHIAQTATAVDRATVFNTPGYCGSCANYCGSGRWSAPCSLLRAAWLANGENAHPSHLIRRADNGCASWESREDDELARASDFPGRG